MRQNTLVNWNEIYKLMKITLAKIIFTLAFLFSILIALNQITFFGLSYDESLFINAAIQRDETTFIAKHWHGFPIMVMNYIGALKSWLYYPIFKLFGVNLLSIRLPMVFLMYINIYLIYQIFIKYFSKTVVFGLIILLFTDFTFINLHKIDHGPTAIETFLKLLCLYFITRKQNLSNSIIIFIILSIGVFNKLNFIWFVNAVYGTYLIYNLFFTENNISIYKKIFNLPFIINSALYILIIICWVFVLKIQHISPNQPSHFLELVNQIIYQAKMMVFTILNLRYGYLLGWYTYHPIAYTAGIMIFLFVIIINSVWAIKKNSKIQSAHYFLLILTFLISIQYFFTKEASNMWHVLMVYPFIQLLIINTFYNLFNNKNWIAKYGFVGICTFWIGFNIITYIDFEKNIKEKCSYWLYEPSINKLADFTQTRPEKNIISLGYGIHSQLLVLDKKEKSYLELIGDTAYCMDILNHNKKYIEPINNTLVVENIKANLNTKRENYQSMAISLAGFQLKLDSLKVINDGCGQPLYNVFKISKR